jgi:osmotically-inducible protein OsmY
MSDIRGEVANALYWDLAVPRDRVTAEVDGGLVTLHGVVERAYEKSSAEATVRRVPGVIGVRNEIAAAQEVGRWHPISPFKLGGPAT